HGSRRLSTAYQHKRASEASTGMGRLCHARRQGGIGVTKPVTTRKRQATEPARSKRARPVSDLLATAGGAAFRRFGFVQSAIVSRWREIVGTRYAAVSAPESIRFAPGKKSNGTLTLVVEGA